MAKASAELSVSEKHMHFLLIYDVGPDFATRRTEFRDEHLELAWKFSDEGKLLLAGALEDPVDQAILLFLGSSPEGARQFAEADPYVRHGLVKRWRVRPWNTVVGEASAAPIKPREVKESLIAKESVPRLADLGGTEKQLRAIRRRRPRNGA